MRNSKSQTATEYLIILAVVIVIALIVIGVLGGIPSIGSGLSEQAARTNLATAKVGVVNYRIGDYDSSIKIKNNNADSIQITSISIGGEICIGLDSFTLRIGESKTITCPNIYEFESSKADLPISIDWVDLNNAGSYTQESSELSLVGSVSETYLDLIHSHSSWNESINGCYDSSANPIPICTCIDLNKTRLDLSANYTLLNSLDFNRCKKEFGVDFVTGNGWDPIGESGSAFTGSFDGAGYVIGGLYINRPAEFEIGLFGNTNSASLSNLNVFGEIHGGSEKVGGLAGLCTSGSISNSYFIGDISGDNKVGGLVGSSSGSISNSYFKGDVYGNSRGTGGLVGYFSGTVVDSHVLGTIHNTGDGTGGLAGLCNSGTISNSHFIGDIFGDDYVGGLAGSQSSTGGCTISDSYVDSDIISGNTHIGGIISTAYFGGNISNSHANVNTLSGTNYVGGIFGSIEVGITALSNSYFIGNIFGDEYVGGFGGGYSSVFPVGDSSAINSFAIANIESSGTYVGGFIGNRLFNDPDTLVLTNTFWYNSSDDDATVCYHETGGASGTVNCGLCTSYDDCVSKAFS